MSAFSNYLEDKLINHILRNTAYTTPGTSIYVALYTQDPTDAGGAGEVSGNNYQRVQVSAWNAPSNGATYNTNEIAFPQASGTWGTISHVAIFDALTVGNLLFHGQLTTSKLIELGDTFKFPAGDLDISVA